MSAQPAVLQVVILRDGLLVGTEVFVPGSYTLGSADGCDVRLDDPSIGKQHATLYFQNGKAAIQDGGTPLGIYVNGHRVKACEVRSQDEVTCGPFVVKIRVVSKAPAEKASPPPEVAALLKGTPPSARVPSAGRSGGHASPGPTVAARQSPVELAATVPGPSASSPPRDGPGTVYSARKRAEQGNAPPPVSPINGHARRPVDDPPTEAVMIPPGLDLDDVVPTGRGARGDPATSRVQLEDEDPFDFGQATGPPVPAARPRAHAQELQTDEEPSLELAVPAKAKKERKQKERKAAKPRPAAAPRFKVGKGTPKLYFELWWG
ncbi:MAG TPA: FHA domain-containing protein, partial [Myxococcaceae bacterium]|nr:FHA domain-containing protein [Myxococcaceae bacterium]